MSECDAIEAKSEASEVRGLQVFLYLASSPVHVVNARLINISVWSYKKMCVCKIYKERKNWEDKSFQIALKQELPAEAVKQFPLL